MSSVAEIAERMEAFDAKLASIIDNRGMKLTAGGQATAIAMLVTMNLPIFGEAAATLRALTPGGTQHGGG